MTLAVPWRDITLVLVVAIIAGLLASVIPGRSAARTSPWRRWPSTDDLAPGSTPDGAPVDELLVHRRAVVVHHGTADGPVSARARHPPSRPRRPAPSGSRLGDLRADLARLTRRPELVGAHLTVDGVVLDDDHLVGTRPCSQELSSGRPVPRPRQSPGCGRRGPRSGRRGPARAVARRRPGGRRLRRPAPRGRGFAARPAPAGARGRRSWSPCVRRGADGVPTAAPRSAPRSASRSSRASRSSGPRPTARPRPRGPFARRGSPRVSDRPGARVARRSWPAAACYARGDDL
ncbi:hypothetical protein NKG05_20630 [Oerskovia sp. M15]